MKTFSLFVVALMLLSCNESQSNTYIDTLANTPQQDTMLKRYKVKSGIITYKITITGDVMGSKITGSGTESLYFTNYGALELVEEITSQTTAVNVFGNKSTKTTETHTMKKLDNGDSYSVDFKQKKIYKIQDPAMQLTKTYEPNADAGEVGEDMLTAIGGKKIGNETYKDFECDIWEAMGIKQWIYKGVTLKSVGTLMGIKTTKEATNIAFNIDVSESHFKLPDYTIVEQDELFGDVEIDTDFNSNLEDTDYDLSKIKNMSFEEWKKKATLNDEELGEMSEAELRETYDMIQKMIKMRG
ncbi:hypothetical protein [Winogradskyella helgolandensis]|uniref:hypothetical protein n=1 Tax=Winogradskyella helgolandensis TaxID=2697010 RepID=UPI0015C9980C|nr:hypothetical protein [Winogradskyella helgolandensis]